MDDSALEALGWSKVPTNEFTTLIGPFWTKVADGMRSVGFVAEAKHKNHIGTVNGGMLTSLADTALGYAVVDLMDGRMHCATAQLQMQFVATAKMGEFVTCTAEIIRRTSELVFLRGLILASAKTVASADGIWKVLSPR